MTQTNFAAVVCRVRALLMASQNPAECNVDRRAGMAIVTTEWYRSILRNATAKQLKWLREHFPDDYYAFH